MIWPDDASVTGHPVTALHPDFEPCENCGTVLIRVGAIHLLPKHRDGQIEVAAVRHAGLEVARCVHSAERCRNLRRLGVQARRDLRCLCCRQRVCTWMKCRTCRRGRSSWFEPEIREVP